MSLRRTHPAVALLAGIVIGLAVAVGVASATLATANSWTYTVGSDDIAAQFNVTVRYFDSGSPCGEVTDASGCFRVVEPNVVYVQSGLDPDIERSVLLHEIAHVIQHRTGVPQDECGADEIAQNLGATWTAYDC